TIVYDIFYNVIPGFSLFRGQERSAYVVAVAASILAGLGTVAILRPGEVAPRRYKPVLWSIVALAFSLGAALFVNWLTTPGTDNRRLLLVTFSLFIAVLTVTVLIYWQRWRPAVLIGLVVFELFSFGRTNPNLESKPASERLASPPLVQTILADHGIFR